MLFEGKIPPYYTKNEIDLKDPRNLAYNLLSQKLDYWTKQMEKDSSWALVTDCMANEEKVKPTLIADERYDFFNQMKNLAHHEFNFQVNSGAVRFADLRALLNQVQISLIVYDTKPCRLRVAAKSIEINKEDLEAIYDDNDSVSESRFRKFLSTTIVPELHDLIPEYEDKSELTAILYENLHLLKNLNHREIPEQTIPPNADFTDAIDIFDKINSQGVALTQADLAMTHVKAKWPEAGDRIKNFLTKMAERSFDFNLSFAARTLGAIATGKSTWETIRGIDRDTLESSWKTAEQVIEYLVTILADEGIPGSEAMTSNNVLIPVIRFLSKHGGSFPDEINRRQSIFWLHHALIWRWYSAQADTKLENDLSTIEKNDSPWESLIDKIRAQNGRLSLQVEARDIEGAASTSAFFNLFYVMLRQRQAKDWFLGITLGAVSDSPFTIDKHHIFPKAFLLKNGYSELIDQDERKINEIANLAFITGTTNKKISDSEPEIYFPEVNQRYPDALDSQLITQDQSLWKVENFKQFLEERRESIAKELNNFLNSYRQQDHKTVDSEGELENLIHAPESDTLEFKETWSYDTAASYSLGKATENRDLNFVVIKTIAGFMNSNGGTLLIGVTDDHIVEGLERDIDLCKGNFDLLQRNISQIVDAAFDAGKLSYFDITFPTYDSYLICRIDVRPCPSTKTWTKYHGDTRFFIRRSGLTCELDPDEADDYWRERIT